jgi:hypothetical protein
MGHSNRWTALLLALLLGVGAGACTRQEVTETSVPTTPVQPPVAAEALSSTQAVFHWLQLTCGLGDEPKLEARLKANRQIAEPILLRAYREGPSSEVMKEFTEAARSRYTTRKATLEAGEIGLERDDLAAAQEVDEEAFLARARADFESRYRSQAKLGLGLIGSPVE